MSTKGTGFASNAAERRLADTAKVRQRRLCPSARNTWIVIFGIAAAHEFFCEDGELLSEAYDRGLEKHPLLIYGFTAVTVAHILNKLPIKADPYNWAWLLFASLKKGSL